MIVAVDEISPKLTSNLLTANHMGVNLINAISIIVSTVLIYFTACKDEYHSPEKCQGWMKSGLCKKDSKYFTWMRENCMKSCGVCGKN